MHTYVLEIDSEFRRFAYVGRAYHLLDKIVVTPCARAITIHCLIGLEIELALVIVSYSGCDNHFLE